MPQVPGSLDESLAALEADNDFLKAGGVFTDDLIETHIAYKRASEIDADPPSAAPLRVRPLLRHLDRRAPDLRQRGSGAGWSVRGRFLSGSLFPTSGTIRSVTVSKVSLSLDEEVLAEARQRAGRRELSSYVNDALRRRLQHDRLGDLLAEMEAESGPIPEDVLVEARQGWHGDRPQRRRRPA